MEQSAADRLQLSNRGLPEKKKKNKPVYKHHPPQQLNVVKY
jgi:hypothetical protein